MDRGLRDIPMLLREIYGSIDYSSFIGAFVKGKDLFEFIVGVMLSQNTSDRNAIKAYNNLVGLLGQITPEKVLQLSLEDLAKALRPAGLYNVRALKIHDLAMLFSDRSFVEKLERDLAGKPVEEARKILTNLPGVGFKTADVVLLMYYGRETFPVDTHIMRITRRLGVLDKYSYEDVRRFWMNLVEPSMYLETHLLLITHGRLTCRARKPLCDQCVLKSFCRYYLSRS